MALQLAERLDLDVNQDALFAAAFLHDLGTFAPYRQAGVDHAVRSAEVAGELLAQVGFPLTKRVPLVQEIIRGHMFSATPGESIEAVLFHDADTLDFLGAAGVARILAIVGLDDWTPDLPTAVSLLQHFRQELPDKLITRPAQSLGLLRAEEMDTFLAALGAETSNLQVL